VSAHLVDKLVDVLGRGVVDDALSLGRDLGLQDVLDDHEALGGGWGSVAGCQELDASGLVGGHELRSEGLAATGGYAHLALLGSKVRELDTVAGDLLDQSRALELELDGLHDLSSKVDDRVGLCTLEHD